MPWLRLAHDPGNSFVLLRSLRRSRFFDQGAFHWPIEIIILILDGGDLGGTQEVVAEVGLTVVLDEPHRDRVNGSIHRADIPCGLAFAAGLLDQPAQKEENVTCIRLVYRRRVMLVCNLHLVLLDLGDDSVPFALAIDSPV